MDGLASRLAEAAARESLSLESARHLHLLHGVVRRWAGSPGMNRLVLGGSLLTQQWVGLSRRSANDLDFVGLFPHDLGATIDLFREALAVSVADGLDFDPDTLHGEITWDNTAFPGARLGLHGRLFGVESEVRIDVGFGFAMVPATQQMAFRCLVGPVVTVPALRPELLLAWKLSRLFEGGPKRWLSKGLFDLDLLTRYLDLNRAMLTEGIRVAFEQAGVPLESVRCLYDHRMWARPAALKKWAKYVASATYPVAGSAAETAARVARALRSVLGGLIELPTTDS